MPHVMLKPGWPGTFHRTLRTPAGGSRAVEFGAGQPIELSDAEVASVLPDLGRALVPVNLDEKGRPRVVELQAEDLADLQASRPAPAPPLPPAPVAAVNPPAPPAAPPAEPAAEAPAPAPAVATPAAEKPVKGKSSGAKPQR